MFRVTEEQDVAEIAEYMKKAQFSVKNSDSGFVFDIDITFESWGKLLL